MLTGRLVGVRDSEKRSIGSLLSRMAGRSGEPVIRTAIRQAMRIMGHQYVMGRTIEEAMKRADKKSNRRFRYSFDMLGEAALTAADARRYFEAYADAIEAIGASTDGGDIFALPSISVKLSALHPRYELDRKSTRLNSSHVAISYAVFYFTIRPLCSLCLHDALPISAAFAIRLTCLARLR